MLIFKKFKLALLLVVSFPILGSDNPTEKQKRTEKEKRAAHARLARIWRERNKDKINKKRRDDRAAGTEKPLTEDQIARRNENARNNYQKNREKKIAAVRALRARKKQEEAAAALVALVATAQKAAVVPLPLAVPQNKSKRKVTDAELPREAIADAAANPYKK